MTNIQIFWLVIKVIYIAWPITFIIRWNNQKNNKEFRGVIGEVKAAINLFPDDKKPYLYLGMTFGFILVWIICPILFLKDAYDDIKYYRWNSKIKRSYFIRHKENKDQYLHFMNKEMNGSTNYIFKYGVKDAAMWTERKAKLFIKHSTGSEILEIVKVTEVAKPDN